MASRRDVHNSGVAIGLRAKIARRGVARNASDLPLCPDRRPKLLKINRRWLTSEWNRVGRTDKSTLSEA